MPALRSHLIKVASMENKINGFFYSLYLSSDLPHSTFARSKYSYEIFSLYIRVARHRKNDVRSGGKFEESHVLSFRLKPCSGIQFVTVEKLCGQSRGLSGGNLLKQK